MRKYRLTFAEEAALIWECAQCGTLDDLCVDHCHASDEVRGVLCAAHNKGLGFFHDSIEELRAAIEYLEAASLPDSKSPVTMPPHDDETEPSPT